MAYDKDEELTSKQKTNKQMFNEGCKQDISIFITITILTLRLSLKLSYNTRDRHDTSEFDMRVNKKSQLL